MEGMKHDSGKPDYSLVPFGALDEVVKVLTYGAKKYDRFNWENVDALRYQAAALRHISAYMQGEKFDPETGINHMAHAVCSLLFLTQFDLNEKDDCPNYTIDLQGKGFEPIHYSIDTVTPAKWDIIDRDYYSTSYDIANRDSDYDEKKVKKKLYF
jgi:hypothetical protein